MTVEQYLESQAQQAGFATVAQLRQHWGENNYTHWYQVRVREYQLQQEAV